jgi:solute:Na+ symporter, SSS family
LTGRWAVVISMLVAAIVAPALKSLDQAYQYIQEYAGFFSPGVLAIFLLGMFWKKTTAAAGLAGAVLTVPFSAGLKFLPEIMNVEFLAPGGFAIKNAEGVFEIPFLDRMTIVFFLIVIIMVIISLVKPKPANDTHIIEMDKSLFKVSPGFIVGSFIICGILAALYTVFW